MMDSVKVDISTCVSICRSLENIIKKLVGPNALHTMISTATGKILISSDGLTVLKSLHLSHPIGRMMIEAVTSHHQQTGNNSKSFILLLSEALRQIQHFTEKSSRSVSQNQSLDSTHCRQDLIRLSHAFHKLQMEILPQEIIANLLKNSIMTEMNEDAHQDVNNICKAIIATSMAGKLSSQTLMIFSTLVFDFISKSAENLDDLHANVLHVIDNFEQFCIEVVGLPMSESMVVDGILIEREFAVTADNFTQHCNDRCNFILVDCDIAEYKPEVDSTFSIESQSQLYDALEFKSKIVESFLQQCQAMGVKLIISTKRFSEMALFMSKKLGISVTHMVSGDTLSGLVSLTSKHVVYGPQELLTSDNVGVAKFCKLFSLGSHRFIHLGIHNENVHQMIVCGPIHGLCRQYYSSVLNSLKSIRMWLQSDMILQDPSSFENLTAKPNPVIGKQLIGICVPGGGAAEFVIHTTLQMLKDSESDAYLKAAYKILSEAVLSVPRTLHENSNLSECKQNSFISQLLEIKSMGCVDMFTMGVNSRDGQLSDMREMCILEPLVSKFMLLNDVLALLQQILRLEMMVSVPKLKICESDSQTEF
ncbi:BBSome complex assembly protein BBS10-like [Glandiceps talaboti]